VPKVEDYASLAPFSLDELVAAANSVLRDRPKLAVSTRTIRYYISKGLLPSPSGGPKFARYSWNHLDDLVKIRTYLDQGLSLEQVATEFGVSLRIEEREDREVISEMRTLYKQAPRDVGELVRRIPLGMGCVLEIPSSADLFDLIPRLKEKLEEL
jgi:DNA-binding transcriptional MerR regulator